MNYENETDKAITRGVPLLLLRIGMYLLVGFFAACGLVFSLYRAYLYLFPQR
jgi:hypothetical protein